MTLSSKLGLEFPYLTQLSKISTKGTAQNSLIWPIFENKGAPLFWVPTLLSPPETLTEIDVMEVRVPSIGPISFGVVARATHFGNCNLIKGILTSMLVRNICFRYFG